MSNIKKKNQKENKEGQSTLPNSNVRNMKRMS